jgi:hypothetical protein
MSPIYKAAFGGWIACSSFHSLYQDIVGKEAYLKIVDAGWVRSGVTIPIALFFIAIACLLFYQALKGR